jgi:DNA mismatch repair protein MutS
LGHFKTHNLKGFGIDDFTSAIAAAGALLYYLNETQQTQLSHISRIQPFNHSDFMLLDYSTRRNLEIVYSYSDNSSNGTLISTLDRTATPMAQAIQKVAYSTVD